MENESKLKNVLGTVLGIPVDSVNDEVSVDSVASWDSLKHMNLVLALEEQFNITFTEEQSVQILNYPLIKAVLSEHGVRFVN